MLKPSPVSKKGVPPDSAQRLSNISQFVEILQFYAYAFRFVVVRIFVWKEQRVLWSVE